MPGCKIRFFRYQGVTEKTGKDYNVIKSQWIEGTVPALIEEAANVLGAQVREFVRLNEDSHFQSVPEYPPEAWYEAIVNACVHRSYNLKSMHITIKMFDDRLEVESPGGFPPMVTPDTIYDTHFPRNPHLMDALFYLRFVQCAHEGSRRIRDSMQRFGLPAPRWTQTEVNSTIVRITLKNDVEHRKEFVDTDAFLVLGEELSGTLSEPERRIVNHIAEHRSVNVTEASRIIDRRWQFTKKLLLGLAARGILDHVHSATVERDASAYFVLKKRFTDRLKG